jgi:hypothetical protein
VFTGPDGWYHFENLTPATYHIVEDSQDKLGQSFIDGQESLGKVYPADQQSSGEARGTAGQDEFTNLQLNAGVRGSDYNFGESGLRLNKRMLLASSPPDEVIVAERMGVPAVAVAGTSGNDAIAVDIDDTGITIAGEPAPFPLNQIVYVDAGGRSVTVTDRTTTNNLSHFQPGGVALRRDNNLALAWGLAVKNAENVTVIANTVTTNLAVLRDSPGNDQLTAAGSTATLAWPGGTLTGRATNFDTVRAVSVAGGQDTIDDTAAHDFVLEWIGNWNNP